MQTPPPEEDGAPLEAVPLDEATPETRDRADAFRVLIVGAGASGLCAGIKLGEAGISYEVIERNSDVGGVWHENTYPDCGVDSANHLYSFSFALNNDWSRYYVKQGELKGYLRDCAERFGVMKHIRFGEEVEAVRYDEAARTLTFDLAQTTDPTPGQPDKQPVVIPVRTALIGENGQPDYHLIVPTVDPHAVVEQAEIEEIKWGSTGKEETAATSERDGLANTRALIASDNDHPAARWASNLELYGHRDWYLPARRELALCYATVPERFQKSGYYWSSSQYSANGAWARCFAYGYQLVDRKVHALRARAVRRFISHSAL